MKENWYKYYKLWTMACGLFIASCAQIVAPTGGERDKIPPKITSSKPENKSTNLTQKEISIQFDEWLAPLTNAKTQVIISPSVEPFPKIDIIKNELSIKFKEGTLQPNTTYSIFFGDNLKDNNEGNILPNYKFIFSTGNYIDSLTVKGKITTTTGKIPENTFLLLYKDAADSAFTSKKPFYISKIGTDGTFNLENVKEGDYKIYALNDKNGNYYYDLPTEEIGFDTSFYHITGNLDTLSFLLFQPEDEKLRVNEFERTIKGGMLNITFNKELSFTKNQISASVSENSKIEPIVFQEKTPNKAKIYFPNLEKDTASFTVLLKNNNILFDSIRVRSESKTFKKPIAFFTDTTLYKNLSVIETQDFKLVASNYCIAAFDTARILLKDTANKEIPFFISRDIDLQTYFIKADWKAGIRYKLQLQDSVFTDLAENWSKMQDFSILATSIKKAGKLLITYELPQKNTNYIVKLKDSQGKVLDTRFLSDSQPLKIDYGLQAAGTYSVEVIEDLNNDGIWNSGIFANKTLPEKIYKEPKPILIKENWDAEETIKIDFSLKPINTETKVQNPTNDSPMFQNKQDRQKGNKNNFEIKE
ncbi:MAG TPA: Ig-like domain-containing protein [Chitinophagales bacterium]|nr:Ig-like domain-containing protein [Chitinophagales bacterium]